MPIFFWRAPRASRLRVAVLAALSFPTAALADPAPETRSPPDASTLDAVHVQGHRSPIHAERALTPGGVSVVDGESFHRRPVTNMADALRYVPGVWIESSTGGDAVFVSSRGSNLDATGYDGNGIKLFQDGLPVSTADGNNHNRFLDPAAARHVVVARGANALTYGASNLGGAIDFISPTARDSPPAQAAFAGGSHGLWSGRLSGGGVSGVSGESVVSDESITGVVPSSLAVVVVSPLLLTDALSEGLSDVPGVSGMVDGPGSGSVTVGGAEDCGVGAGVTSEVFVGVPALGVTEGTMLGAGSPLPLGAEDCDEQPKASPRPETDKSNTDGKNDFIRVPERRRSDFTQRNTIVTGSTYPGHTGVRKLGGRGAGIRRMGAHTSPRCFVAIAAG